MKFQAATIMLLLGFLPIVGEIVEIWGSYVLLAVASLYGGVLRFVQRRADLTPFVVQFGVRNHNSHFSVFLS